MTKAVLGIIGGSGIYDLPGLTNAQSKTIETPWVKPSSALLTGEIAGLPIVLLSRHDKGHRLSPSDINYRANIDVLELTDFGLARWHEINAAASAERNLDIDFLLGLVERGTERGLRVRFWNTTSKYSTETPDGLCPWPFERAYISSDQRVVPCCFIGNPDVVEIGTRPEKPASFASVWFGLDFQAFRQAHLDGNIPHYCRGCYRDTER